VQRHSPRVFWATHLCPDSRTDCLEPEPTIRVPNDYVSRPRPGDRSPISHRLILLSAWGGRQIVIPADARAAMQIKEGDKVVILRGLREGSVLVFRVDSFAVLLQKAGIADDERTAMAAEHKPTR